MLVSRDTLCPPRPPHCMLLLACLLPVVAAAAEAACIAAAAACGAAAAGLRMSSWLRVRCYEHRCSCGCSCERRGGCCKHRCGCGPLSRRPSLILCNNRCCHCCCCCTLLFKREKSCPRFLLNDFGKVLVMQSQRTKFFWQLGRHDRLGVVWPLTTSKLQNPGATQQIAILLCNFFPLEE